MRKFILLLPFINFITTDSFSNEPERIITDIFNDLELIIKKSEIKNEYVENCFDLSLKSIINREIAVVYDSTLINSLYGCCSITTNEDLSIVRLNIGKVIINNYEKHPSIIQAIIIHEFQHLYDLKTKPDLFIISLSNQIEKLYFDVDALVIEAMFLNDFIKPNHELSPFEKYLCSDLKNNMISASTLFEDADINLVHQIDALDVSDKEATVLISELTEIGSNLLKEYKINPDNSDWAKYCNYTTLSTFVKYYRQALYDIVNSKSKKITPEGF